LIGQAGELAGAHPLLIATIKILYEFLGQTGSNVRMCRAGGELVPFLRIALASLLMGVGCWMIWRLTVSVAPIWVALMVTVGSGVVLYGASCRALRVQELSTASRWLGKLPPLQFLAGE
jgi:hypothetical protein